MRSDFNNWEPLSVEEVHGMFSNLPVKWGIAGGWALDLHYGQTTRPHDDIDILLFREEQLNVYRHLSKEWVLYRAEKGTVSRWDGEYLHSTHDVWACRNDTSPWAFQLMLVDSSNDGQWVYRRETTIRKPVEHIFLKSPHGVPYLKPEIQLLYKGGGSTGIRAKDQQDFNMIMPVLTPPAKKWLHQALSIQFPSGHPWLTQLESQSLPENFDHN